MSFNSSRFTLACLLAVGCAHAAPPELRDARDAYQRAAAGPAAQRSPAQLLTAQDALTLAERSFKDDGDTVTTRDLAYVATRRAEIAEVDARTAEFVEREAATLAGQRLARESSAAATREELSRTRAALASEQATSAGAQERLEEERTRRAEAERRAALAVADLARIASVTQDPRGTVLTISGSVLFASGKSALLPTAEVKLRQVADALKSGDPGATFVVEGHTDSRGNAQRNQELSEDRARVVRDFLVGQGVEPDRITSQGFGSTRPLAENSSAEGRANNRRVELVIRPAP